jgi:hypothetical protein
MRPPTLHPLTGHRPVTAIVVHHERPEAASATTRRFLAQDIPVRVLVVDSGS